MKTLLLVILMMGMSFGAWAEPIRPCLPASEPIPTVVNKPIWIYPNRDTPNWYIVPTYNAPPRTSSSVPSRGG